MEESDNDLSDGCTLWAESGRNSRYCKSITTMVNAVRLPCVGIDMAGLARAQGARGFGPITQHDELASALAHAVTAVEAGEVAVVDVRIEPGYGARDSGAMSQRRSA